MTFSSLKIATLGIVLLTALAFYWHRSVSTYRNDPPQANFPTSNERITTKANEEETAIANSIDEETINLIKEIEVNEIEPRSETNIQTSLIPETTVPRFPPEAEVTDVHITQPSQPEQYEAEEIDSYWAFDKEGYYIDLFSETESLAGFVLSEAQCKSRQCKLSFLLANQEQKDEITNRLMEKLMAESHDLRVSFDLNSSSDEAVLYIEDVKEF